MKRPPLLAIAGTILLILLSACSTGSSGGSMEDDIEVVLPEGVLFQVATANGEPVSFTVEQVKALPQVTIEVDGKTEEGPALLTVLEKAGVGDYSSVTLQGVDLSITLNADEITDEVILDITNRDTVKFASPTVSKQEWPKDIILIAVE